MKTYEMNVDLSLTVKTCPVCFVVYAAPAELFKRKDIENSSWYCPNGHSLVFTESEYQKLQKKLKQAEEDKKYWQNRKADVDAQNEILHRQISAKKGQITKLKNRVANGVCPCCNRHFTNLERHMSKQHPSFKNEE